MIIKNGIIFSEDFSFIKKDIRISDGRIKSIGCASDSAYKDAPADDVIIDASDCYVIPGLIDIHFHGCVGHDFSDGTDEAITAIARYELASGVTSICPATMTLPAEKLSSIVKCAAEHNASDDESDFCGINLEGPFVSYEKKGAQNPLYLMNPDQKLVKRLCSEGSCLVKLITIAPELPGAVECIENLHNELVFSVGHTTADYDTAATAFKAGASHVTHLYNAMPAFTHRAPGVIGAAADADKCDVELICDGIHINPSVIRATFKLFGDERVILISDSMMACGMPDGQYELGGLPVSKKGNLATLNDGTLAGSATNLFDCMRHAIEYGIRPESAIRAATANPACSIHIDDEYGFIKPGCYANLLILNKDFTIKQIYHRGKLV